MTLHDLIIVNVSYVARQLLFVLHGLAFIKSRVD